MASTPVELEMTAGLPYNRRFRVVGGSSIWPSLDSLEIRSQVRQGKLPSTPLVADLRPFLTASFDGADIVVDLSLKGENTRTLAKGYYDIVISDPGAEDARALVIASGKVKVGTTVTAAVND